MACRRSSRSLSYLLFLTQNTELCDLFLWDLLFPRSRFQGHPYAVLDTRDSRVEVLQLRENPRFALGDLRSELLEQLHDLLELRLPVRVQLVLHALNKRL